VERKIWVAAKRFVAKRTNSASDLRRGDAAGLPTWEKPCSLEERYGTHEKYVERVREAAKRLVRERFLLQEDADGLVREAEASAVLR
jgi:hypothetical protein